MTSFDRILLLTLAIIEPQSQIAYRMNGQLLNFICDAISHRDWSAADEAGKFFHSPTSRHRRAIANKLNERTDVEHLSTQNHIYKVNST